MKENVAVSDYLLEDLSRWTLSWLELLTVVAAGNFSQASSRLFITQSTVSARIATLEEQLGCRLFVRNKAGTSLTPAGYRFQNYAVTLVRTLERARQDIGVVRGYRASITIGVASAYGRIFYSLVYRRYAKWWGRSLCVRR